MSVRAGRRRPTGAGAGESVRAECSPRRTPSGRHLAGLRAAAVVACAAASSSACLFVPDVATHGYTACATDADCAPGRACDASLCAPPPWRDERYKARQLLVVQNPADVGIPAGAAVPLRVGGDGLPVDAFPPDAVFTSYDVATGAWSDVPAHLDVQDGFLDAWLPLPADLPAGGAIALAWIESARAGEGPRAIESPYEVFPFFDDFADGALSPEQHRVAGAPVVSADGLVVADNQLVIWRTPLQPPFAVVFRARFDGTTCDQVFLGVYGDDAVATYAAPSAGLFVGADLQADGDVAPGPADEPTPLGAPTTLDTALRRYAIHVDVDRFEVFRDDASLGALDLPRGFTAPDGMFPAVDVDGACSVTVDAVWATPLPLPRPVIRAEAVVGFRLLR